jgi:GTP diphosphokinase / guanosine-3',5'-bis(diphosphate) 3'-diphosphatase
MTGTVTDRIEQSLAQKRPLSPQMQAYQQDMTTRLTTWHAPDEIRQAARLLPWCSDPPLLAQECDALPPEIKHLITEWHDLRQLTLIPTAGVRNPEDARSRKLRCLMRAAYLNLPVVILTIAEHAAQIEAMLPITQENSFWEDTETIFLPLLRMLGLWQLRRQWVEKTAQFRYPKEFEEIQAKLEKERHHQRQCLQKISAHLRQWSETVEIKLRDIAPGRILYRSRQGDAIDELYRTLVVTLHTDSVSDCYRLLGPVHQMGIPIQGRVSDYIAQPHSNGYQGLHTLVRVDSQFSHGQIETLTFRILSGEMSRLNMWGIIADKYRQEIATPPPNTWWRQTEQDNKALALLRAYDVGQPPAADEAHIYVFTPQGDIRRLKQESNVLDFAYRLHTEMGHHCRTAQVNGQSARHDAELINGDMVHLIYDPRFPGPDPAWLHIAHDPYTRTKIKHGLDARQSAVHEGRALLDRFLDALAEESGFIVPEPQLEKYLTAAMTYKGLPDKASLFDALTSEERHTRIAPEQLVAFILESELATAVLDKDQQPVAVHEGKRPTLTRPILRFCPNCKPAPGSPIVLHRKATKKGERLTVHRAPQPDAGKRKRFFGLPHPAKIKCLEFISADEIEWDVHWKEVPQRRMAANLTILGHDRSHLVGDVLRPIYDNDRITLSRIEATADSDGIANIWLTVACDTQQQVDALRQAIEAIQNVIKVAVWPVSSPQVAHLKARYGGRSSNPYTPNPVDDPQMLFGREQEIAQLRDWIERGRPERLILVHGERRAGKTSLVRLARTYLRGPIRSVYVDLLWKRTTLTRAGIYHLIAKEISNSLAKTISDVEKTAVHQPAPLSDWEADPGDQLRTYLRNIHHLIAPQRILIILDEFNLLVENNVDPALYSDLRALTLDEFPWLTLLLVTHSSQVLKIAADHPAWELFQQSQRLPIAMLTPYSARELVEKPTRNFLKFQPDVVNQIINNTNGHPYLINLLCHALVQHVTRRGHNYINHEDLRMIEREFLRHGDNNFQFAIEKIDTQARTLVVALSQQQQENGTAVSLRSLANRCHTSPHDTRRKVEFLCDHGILNWDKESKTSVQFSIPYFCRWVNRYWTRG